MTSLELLKPFIDYHGLIAQSNGDEGDSLEREGLLVVAEALKRNNNLPNVMPEVSSRYIDNLSRLRCEMLGNYKRGLHGGWVSQPDRMSRDQLTSNIVAMGLIDDHTELKRCLIGHLMRLMLFTTNIRGNGALNLPLKLPDVTGPSIWASYIRSLNISILYPLLLLSDWLLVAQSVWCRVRFHMSQDNSDILSHMCLLYQSELQMPTPMSKLAVAILRPIQRQCIKLYFDPQSGAPPFDEIFQDVLM